MIEKNRKAYEVTEHSVKDIRQSSDYDDLYLISKEEVIEQVNNAGLFCK